MRWTMVSPGPAALPVEFVCGQPVLAVLAVVRRKAHRNDQRGVERACLTGARERVLEIALCIPLRAVHHYQRAGDVGLAFVQRVGTKDENAGRTFHQTQPLGAGRAGRHAGRRVRRAGKQPGAQRDPET